MRGSPAGGVGPHGGRAKGAAMGSARRFAATGNSCTAETFVCLAVGRMVAWGAACAYGSELRCSRAATGRLSSPGRRSLGLDRFPCWKNHLVASLVFIRPERVVPPPPRRIILRLRYTDKLRDEYSGDQCVSRECVGCDCLRRTAEPRC